MDLVGHVDALEAFLSTKATTPLGQRHHSNVTTSTKSIDSLSNNIINRILTSKPECNAQITHLMSKAFRCQFHIAHNSTPVVKKNQLFIINLIEAHLYDEAILQLRALKSSWTKDSSDILDGIPIDSSAELPVVHLAVSFTFLVLQCLLQYASKNLRSIYRQENKLLDKSSFERLAKSLLPSSNFSAWMEMSVRMNSPNVPKYSANIVKLLKGFVKISDLLIARGLDIKTHRDCIVLRLLSFCDDSYTVQRAPVLEEFLDDTNCTRVKYENTENVPLPLKELMSEFRAKNDRTTLSHILAKLDADPELLNDENIAQQVNSCPLSAPFVSSVTKCIKKSVEAKRRISKIHFSILDHFAMFLKDDSDIEQIALLMFDILKEFKQTKRISNISNTLFHSGLAKLNPSLIHTSLLLEKNVAETESPRNLVIKVGKAAKIFIENNLEDDARKILIDILPVLCEVSGALLISSSKQDDVHVSPIDTLDSNIKNFDYPSLVHALARCLSNPIFATEFDDCITDAMFKSVLVMKILAHIEKNEKVSVRSAIAHNMMTMLTIADPDYLALVRYTYYDTNGLKNLILFETVANNPILNCGLSFKKLINFGWSDSLLMESIEHCRAWTPSKSHVELDIFKHYIKYLRYLELSNVVIELLAPLQASDLEPSVMSLISLDYCHSVASLVHRNAISFDDFSNSLSQLNDLIKTSNSNGLNQVIQFNILQLDYLVSTNQFELASEKFDKMLKVMKSRSEFSLGARNISAASKFRNLILIAQFQVISARLNGATGKYFAAFSSIKVAIKILYSVIKKSNASIPCSIYNEIKWETTQTIVSSYTIVISILQRLGITRDLIYYLDEFKKMTESIDNPILASTNCYHLIVYYAFLQDVPGMRTMLSNAEKYRSSPIVRDCSPVESLRNDVMHLFDFSELDDNVVPRDRLFKFNIDLDASKHHPRLEHNPDALHVKTRSDMQKISSAMNSLPFSSNLGASIKVLPTIVSKRTDSNEAVSEAMPASCIEIVQQLSQCNQALMKFVSTKSFTNQTIYEMRDMNNLLNHCLSLLSSVTIFYLDSNLLADLYYLQDFINTLPFKNDRRLNHSSSGTDDLLPRMLENEEHPTNSTNPNVSAAFHLDLNLSLPEKWVVVSVDICPTTGDLLMSRFTRGSNPYFVRLPLKRKAGSRSFSDVSNAFKELISESDRSTKSAVTSKVITKEDRKSWWKVRFSLDQRMHDLLEHVEEFWLGAFKSLFNHYRTNDVLFGKFKKDVAKIIDGLLPAHRKNKFSLDDSLMYLFYSMESYNKEEVDDLLQYILDQLAFHGEAISKVNLSKCHQSIELLYDKCFGLREEMFEHLVLIPSAQCSFFPWESLPGLRRKSVSRMPSVHLLIDLLKNRSEAVSTNRVCYMVNPGGDLKRTEERFRDQFQSKPKWHGLMGKKPDNSDTLLEDIIKSDLFIYLGHGGCEQYVKTSSLFKRCLPDGPHLPPSLLIGCSSGALQTNGLFEPSGNIYNWITCGSPMVLVNLWDVTDKDIDLFTVNVFESWGLMRGVGNKTLCESVSEARNYCNLKFLNGAAPVVYGIPLVLK